MIFNILWEMVVSSNINLKVSAAYLLKVIVSLAILLESLIIVLYNYRSKTYVTSFIS